MMGLEKRFVMTDIKYTGSWRMDGRLTSFFLLSSIFLWGCGGGATYKVFNSALELVEAGEIERGEIELLHALTYDPSYAEGWNQLGIIAFERGEFELARERFQTAMRLDRLNAVYPRNLAMVFAELGQFPVADDLLTRSLDLDSGAADTWVVKAKIEILRGDAAASETALRRALAYDPSHTEALDLLARLRVSAS